MPIIKGAMKQTLIDENVLGNIPSYMGLPAEDAFGDLAGMDDLADKEWSLEGLKLTQTFARNVMANVGSSVGFPSGPIYNGAKTLFTMKNPAGELGNLFEALGGNVRGPETFGNLFMLGGANSPVSIVAKSMTELLGPALEAVGAVVGAAANCVPIIGGVVNALIGVIKFFGGMAAQDEPAEFSYKIAKFLPVQDVAFANAHVLETARGVDWTTIWSPPGIGQGMHSYSSDWLVTTTMSGDDEWGLRLTAADADRAVGEDNWTGAVPLSGNIDLGWEISNSGLAEDGTRSLGALLPTAKDQIAKLWSIALKPGAPAAFCVDTELVRGRWLSYLARIRYFLQGTDSLTESQKKQFINGAARTYFGWANYSPDLDMSMSTEHLYGDFGYNITNSDLMRAIDDLAAVQNSSIDTIACAYIDETFGAIKGSSALRTRLRKNKELLLQHPEVCRLDLDSIPETAYRQAVALSAAQRGCPKPGAGGLYAGTMMLSAGPLVAGSAPPPPPPANLNGLQVKMISATPGGGNGGGDDGGGNGAILLMAMAALGLIVLNKKR